jgi:hypothetical protein
MQLFDGSYDFVVSAHEYAASGSALVAAGELTGQDGAFMFSGTVREEGRTLAAAISFVLGSPDQVPVSLRRNFVLSAAARPTRGGFELLGTGPYGNIVELRFTRKGP